VPASGTPANGGSYVLQGNFETAKKDIKDAFVAVKATINSSGTGGVGSLTNKVNKAIKRLGEIKGRVTGKSYSKGGFVFCSMTEVGNWLAAKKVPSGGVFWPLSVLVCMKTKQQTGKAQADETDSSECTNLTTLENDLLASMTHTRP
jgi:hypothetical protein